MKIIKNKDNYLLKNKNGEYHFSHKEYESLGKEKAIEKAKNEIAKKTNASYQDKTIDFKRARLLGFCEYGIKDFCKKLELDVNETYSILELNKLLTIDALKEYPEECIKLFGKNTLKYLGGVRGIISEDTISLVLRPEFIPEKTLHILSTKFAYQCLDNYEKEYPDDDKVRKAIESKAAWIRGDITNEQLSAAKSSAWAAAESAKSSAWAAAESAESAAWSAWSAVKSAESAAWSAWSAAKSAARSAKSAARSAESAKSAKSAESSAKQKQVEIILKELKKDEL